MTTLLINAHPNATWLGEAAPLLYPARSSDKLVWFEPARGVELSGLQDALDDELRWRGRNPYQLLVLCKEDDVEDLLEKLRSFVPCLWSQPEWLTLLATGGPRLNPKPLLCQAKVAGLPSMALVRTLQGLAGANPEVKLERAYLLLALAMKPDVWRRANSDEPAEAILRNLNGVDLNEAVLRAGIAAYRAALENTPAALKPVPLKVRREEIKPPKLLRDGQEFTLEELGETLQRPKFPTVAHGSEEECLSDWRKWRERVEEAFAKEREALEAAAEDALHRARVKLYGQTEDGDRLTQHYLSDMTKIDKGDIDEAELGADIARLDQHKQQAFEELPPRPDLRMPTAWQDNMDRLDYALRHALERRPSRALIVSTLGFSLLVLALAALRFHPSAALWGSIVVFMLVIAFALWARSRALCHIRQGIERVRRSAKKQVDSLDEALADHKKRTQEYLEAKVKLWVIESNLRRLKRRAEALISLHRQRLYHRRQLGIHRDYAARLQAAVGEVASEVNLEPGLEDAVSSPSMLSELDLRQDEVQNLLYTPVLPAAGAPGATLTALGKTEELTEAIFSGLQEIILEAIPTPSDDRTAH